MSKSQGEETIRFILERMIGLKEGEDFIHDKRVPGEARKWRPDFRIPSSAVLVEYEGGQWMKKSGHNTGSGLIRDINKHNEMSINGWAVIRFTTDHLRDPMHIKNTIERAMRRRR